MKEKILIIDDDKSYAASLAASLKKEFQVFTAANKIEAREMLTFNMDAVLLDINFSGEKNSGDTSGFAILEEIREEFVLLPVIMLSNYESPAVIINAFRKGAGDYVIKGLLDITELRILIRGHLEKRIRIKATITGGSEIDFIGTSPQTRQLKEEIARIAPLDTTILISGETGVGKEVAARYIHHLSPRAGKPFVPVNIAALPASMVEAELFGYKKGAFTGAAYDKKGYFETANYGTLFLDEIGDLPFDLQTKLLRFFQERTVTPLGSTQMKPVDIRLVCATNKDLLQEIKKGNFREDLYYRINVYPVTVPPLRERNADIRDLAAHFINNFSRQSGINVKEVAAPALEALVRHKWNGNVRELCNVIESAAIRASINHSRTITMDHLPADLKSVQLQPVAVDVPLEDKTDVEREMNRLFVRFAEQALENTMGNKLEAAHLLGLKNDETLRYKIKTIYKDYSFLVENTRWIEKLYGYFKKV